ncbi:hypothetical protein PMAYCL1PPCAC_29010, partial [Pristionchus mayeri]
ECMKENGYDFFVARIYKSDGEVDYKGVQNIRNTHAAGMRSVHALLNPCMVWNCPTAENQVALAINATKGTQFDILWLNINAFLTWPADKDWNRQFILDMVKKTSEMGHTAGIYTDESNWAGTVGDWRGMSTCPLRWLNYGLGLNFDDFPSFGGWNTPQLRHFNDNLKGPCSVG